MNIVVERIKNGGFLAGLTDWGSGSLCALYNWNVAVYPGPPSYCSISSYDSGCVTHLNQDVDLTGVNDLTFTARGWVWPDFCGPGWMRVVVDSTVVWQSTLNIDPFAAQHADVSSFLGSHLISFDVWGVLCGVRMDVTNISAISTIEPTILFPIDSFWSCVGAAPWV